MGEIGKALDAYLASRGYVGQTRAVAAAKAAFLAGARWAVDQIDETASDSMRALAGIVAIHDATAEEWKRAEAVRGCIEELVKSARAIVAPPSSDPQGDGTPTKETGK